MRKVFSSGDGSQIMLVRAALARAGIEVTLQNENESLVPMLGCVPAELWVMHDGDAERAAAIVAATLQQLSSTADGPTWTCAHCHEESPPAFEICWKCGKERPVGGSA